MLIPYNKLKLNNKGSHLLFIIMNLMFVVIAVYLIFLFAIRSGSSKEVAVTNLAYEFSSMINIISGDDNQINVGFPQDLTEYGFILTQNSIMVYTLDKENGDFKSEKTFTLPTGVTAAGAVEGVADICLHKKEDILLLAACKEATS